MALKIATAKKPRLFLLYTIAPEGFHPSKANQVINNLIASDDTPLCIYHDHFLGQPGGIAIFDVKHLDEVDKLAQAINDNLPDWNSDLKPLIFSFNPAAFDQQIAYTTSAYGKQDWNALKQEKRPSYGDPRKEVETASEE